MATNKKRILVFVPEFPVLSETFIQREIVKLAQFSDVDLVVAAIKKGPALVDPVLNDKVTYIGLSPVSLIQGAIKILFNPAGFIKNLKSAVSNRNRGIFSSLYLLLKSYAYSSVFGKYKPDLIFVHFLSEPSTIIYFVSLITGIPFCISAHARDVFGRSHNHEINPELVKEKAHLAKFIVVCNAKAHKKCIELAGSENTGKILLHYHGADPTLFENIDASGIEEIKKPLVFSVGRLEEKKGFTYLIAAAKILKERDISFLIKIAGPGPLYKELMEQINNANLSQYVEIAGDGKGLPNGTVLKYLSMCKLFVLPSIETSDLDAEGIPNTLIEASFMKKAIVSTATGSIPELITQYVNGILVVPKNEYVLADAIEKLIMETSLNANLGQKAYEVAKDKFNLNKNITELKELLVK